MSDFTLGLIAIGVIAAILVGVFLFARRIMRRRKEDRFIDKFVGIIKDLLHTSLAIATAIGLGFLIFLWTGNLIGAVACGALWYGMSRSGSFTADNWYFSLLMGMLYFSSHTISANSITLSILIFITTFFTLWAASKAIVNEAEKNRFFTTAKLNEYRAVETPGGTLIRFIGMAKRWSDYDVNPKRGTSEEEKREENKQASKEAVLESYVPHPKTGKITKVKKADYFIPWRWWMLVIMYFMNRFGIVWIGLAGLVGIRKMELRFKKLENGEIIKKNFEGDEAVDTAYDSYPYVFVARDLETEGNLKIFIEGLVTLYIDNLYTMFYGRLPVGSWINNAEGEFRDIAKEHASITDYQSILEEQQPGNEDQVVERADRKKPISDEEKKALSKNAKDTFYSRILDLVLTRPKFIKMSGTFPTEVDIINFGLEKDPAMEDALKKKKLNQLNQGAELEFQTKEVEIQKQKTLQALEERKQRAARGSAEADILEEIITKVASAKDNAEIMRIIRLYQVSKSKLLVYNEDPAQAGKTTVLVRDEKDRGGDDE